MDPSGILAKVNLPSDLKHLSLPELSQLAEEMRRFLLLTVSQTGGHFASNLGTVELTLALHYVFNAPRDKLVWDVGHQAYPHKIVTGRKERMATIRQYGGLAPFLRRDESPYDAFGAGHAGTAISAAYGMAVARDMKDEDFKVIAVAGDAALTAGMAFEALNHSGHSGRDFIIVLNDNKMSIGRSVGALSHYFNRLITDPRYNRYKGTFEQLVRDVPLMLRELPLVKSSLSEIGSRIQEGLKNLFVPDMLFEELGFRYFGPIDGHNLADLIPMLERIRDNVHEPALVHVYTIKGKGFEKSEAYPEEFYKDHSYHALSPKFDVTTWQAPRKSGPEPPSYTRVFADTLIELAERDERIVAITAAMPGGTGLDRFAERFPDRTFDVGIAEQHAVTFAAGLATEGFRPVVAIYSTFLQRAFDQVIHDVCIQNLPVTFCLDRGGIVGQDGDTHQGAFDLSYLRMIPNMIVMAPADEQECRRMIATALAHPGPAAVRYPRGPGPGVPMEGPATPLPPGKGRVMRPGEDVALVAVGVMVPAAQRAAELLAADGLSAAVIDARFIKPLDETLILEHVRRVPRLVTLEENVLAGGFGSAVLEMLERAGEHEIAVRRIGLPDRFVEHGAPEILRQKFGLDAESIATTVKEFLAHSGSARGLAGLRAAR
ncbi:1-deoxy-D-xylulose-5-phosphate synthase [bacterium]|nr:1-deoxy-D-xylulose-5-phosphate synthase [bacterium]